MLFYRFKVTRKERTSIVLADLELLVAVAAVEDELLVVVLVDKTLINGLAHQSRSDLTSLVLLLEDLDLLLGCWGMWVVIHSVWILISLPTYGLFCLVD